VPSSSEPRPVDFSTLSEALIIDDEPEVLELLVEYFRTRGLRVASAGDGRAAIAAIEREPARYGLIITDLQLPGVDGIGVLEVAKRANPSCYVVIVTGYASIDTAIQAVRLGAYDYLTKPFSLGQLDVVLQRIHDRVRLEEENRRLVRRTSARDAGEGRPLVMGRLDAIEGRLARIESLLETLSSKN
jgi:DNA-binding NtrC family response regulator